MAIIAGSLAALGAWGINSMIVKRWGDAAISVLVPVIEEILKTLLAITFSTSILLTHFIFGLIEAVWDIKSNIKGLKAGITSIITHSFFGVITWFVLQQTDIISLSIMTGIIAHIVWNSLIINTGR